MIKKILFVCCLIHITVIICGQTKIPTNSTEKNIVSNWAIANIQNFDEKNINNVVENTASYFNQNQKDRLADLYQTVNIVIDKQNYVHSVSVKDEMRPSLVNDL